MAKKSKETQAKEAQVKDAANGTFGEVKTMVTDYAKQQTVEPLKNLGQWAAFGVAGGVMLIIGALLTGLGLLRFFQKWSFLEKECDIDGVAATCDTAWTFLPYMFVFAILLAVAGACFFAMTKTPEWMDDDE